MHQCGKTVRRHRKEKSGFIGVCTLKVNETRRLLARERAVCTILKSLQFIIYL